MNTQNPMDGIIFAGREQRDALLGGDALGQLQTMERELKQPGWAAMQIDKESSARWLSSRLNRPYEEVVANFEPYSRNYFGRVITPAAVYDEIVKYEQDQSAMASGPAIPATQKADKPEGGMSEGEAALKPGQFIRTAGGAFEKAGQDTAAGTFSIIEGVLNTLGGTPERVGVSTDEYYVEAIQKLDRLERNRLGNTAEAAKLRGIVEGKARELDQDFFARKHEYENATVRGALASTAREHADFFYELGSESFDRYGSDPAYRETYIGQAAAMSGQMVATSALMASGSLATAARAGRIGSLAVKVGANVAGGAQVFAGVTQERKQFMGDDYRNEGWQFAGDFVNAGVQQAIEAVPFLDNALEKAIKFAPHTGGTVSLGKVLRRFPAQAAKSGGVEAAEEVLQGAWSDYIVDMGYDDERVDISDGKWEYIKRRSAEAFAGFAGGVMMAGAVTPLEMRDQNNASRKASKLLSAKDGGLFMERDFQLLRQAQSDAQIKAMPEGDTLLAAANGDRKAMASYNRAVVKQNFKQTDGLELPEGKLGMFEDKPAILKDDGDFAVFDLSNPRMAQLWSEAQQAAVLYGEEKDMRGAAGEQAVADMVEYVRELQAERGGTTTIETKAKITGPEERLGREAAQKMLDEYKAAGMLPADATLERIIPHGESDTKWDDKTRQFVTSIRIAEGASPMVVLEESAHDYFKRQIELGQFNNVTVDGWRREVEAGWDGAMAYTDMHEWLAKYAVGYAMGKVLEPEARNLPASFKQFLDRFAKFFKESLDFAAKLMQMERDGALPADFLRALQEATGTSDAQMARRATQAELEAVFAQLPPEAQRVAEKARNDLADFERLKNEYRQAEALQMQEAKNADRKADAAIAQGLEERMREVEFARAKAEQAIDDALNLPEGTELSAQAQRMMDQWASYSLATVAPPTSSSPARPQSTTERALSEEMDRIFQEAKMATWQGLGLADVANMQAQTYAARVKTATDTEKLIRSGGIADELGRRMMTVASELDRLAPGLGATLQRTTHENAVNTTRDKKVMIALGDKITALPNANEVLLQFQTLARRDDRAAVMALAKLNGFEAELLAAEATLAEIRRDAIEAGVETSRFWSQPENWKATEEFKEDMAKARRVAKGRVGEAVERVLEKHGWAKNIDFYWPSKVFDLVGLREFMGNGVAGSRVEQAYRDAEAQAIKQGREINEGDLTKLISQIVNGGKGKAGPGSLKARTIANEDINFAVMQFYYSPIEAALMHVESMRKHIQQRQFFGQSIQINEREDSGVGIPPIDIEQSSKVLVASLAAAGKIDRSTEEQLKKLIDARFNAKQASRIVSIIRALGYVTSLGQAYSGQTATLDALGIGLREDYLNPIGMFMGIVQAATGKNFVTLEKLGIDTKDMGEEYMSGNKWENTMVKTVFKYNLMSYFARFYAQAGLNQALARAMKQARRGEMDWRKQKRLERLFGEQAKDVMADLANGRKTPETLFYAWATVADYQPISQDQQSHWMLSSNYGKLFAQFKSFLTVQFSGMRDDAWNEIKSGDVKRIANGTRFLLSLAATLLMIGLPADMLRAWVTGRTFVLDDQIAARLLGLIGLSPYLIREGQRGGPSKVVASLLIPAVGGAADDLTKDAMDLKDILASGADVPMTEVIGNLRILQNVPIGGRIWAERFGAHSEKNKQNREDIGWFVPTKPEDENADRKNREATRKRLEKKYQQSQ